MFRLIIDGNTCQLIIDTNKFINWFTYIFFLYQISWIFVINQVPCVSSCWGEKTHTRGLQRTREPHTNHYTSRPVTKKNNQQTTQTSRVGGNRSKERDRKSELLEISSKFTLHTLESPSRMVLSLFSKRAGWLKHVLVLRKYNNFGNLKQFLT